MKFIKSANILNNTNDIIKIEEMDELEKYDSFTTF